MVLLVGGMSLDSLTFGRWLPPWRRTRLRESRQPGKAGTIQSVTRQRLRGREEEGTLEGVDTNNRSPPQEGTPRFGSFPRKLFLCRQTGLPRRRPASRRTPCECVGPGKLKLVRNHLSPTMQRLYDSHWRWWELFTHRRGVCSELFVASTCSWVSRTAQAASTAPSRP